MYNKEAYESTQQDYQSFYVKLNKMVHFNYQVNK